MHNRRSLAATAAALVTTLPLLTSCGFALNTDLPYTPAAGTDDRTGPVDVLSAVVVSSATGEGTFIATLSNKNQSESATFDSVQGAEGNAVVPADSEPVEIAPGGFVNLADGGGVKLTGTFTAGDTIPLSIGFSDAGSDVELIVPVVRACDEWAGLDPAAPAASAGATDVEPTDAPETVDPDAEASADDAEGASEAAAGGETDPYACTSTDEQE